MSEGMRKIDQILQVKKQVEQDLKAGRLDYLGSCPECFQFGEYFQITCRNINRQHFMCCDKHKVFWHIGSNLFSNWREETEEVWQENRDLLSQYTEVAEWHPDVLFNLDKIQELERENNNLKRKLKEITPLESLQPEDPFGGF